MLLGKAILLNVHFLNSQLNQNFPTFQNMYGFRLTRNSKLTIDVNVSIMVVCLCVVINYRHVQGVTVHPVIFGIGSIELDGSEKMMEGRKFFHSRWKTQTTYFKWMLRHNVDKLSKSEKLKVLWSSLLLLLFGGFFCPNLGLFKNFGI